MKQCSKCKQDVPLTEFYRNKSRGDGLHTECKPCARARQRARSADALVYQKEWYARNREREAFKNRARKYGMTAASLQALLDAQNGCCASCHDLLGTGREQHIDHCHDTGRVRGVLCLNCNLALGYTKDDPERISALLSYLERHADHV